MSRANCWKDETEYDFQGIVEGLNRYLKLKAMPIGMKRFRTVEEMEAVPRIRRPDPAEKLATDQVVGQSRWIGWTLGITMENLMGDQCGAHTFPYIEAKNSTAKVEHEATTSKIGDDQLFYCLQRGIKEEDAVNMIVNGFCKEVFKELPMEFAVEAQKLLELKLEGAVG